MLVAPVPDTASLPDVLVTEPPVLTVSVSPAAIAWPFAILGGAAKFDATAGPAISDSADTPASSLATPDNDLMRPRSRSHRAGFKTLGGLANPANSRIR